MKENNFKSRQEPSDLAAWKVGEADDTILLPASVSAEIRQVRDTQPVCRILKAIDTVTLWGTLRLAELSQCIIHEASSNFYDF